MTFGYQYTGDAGQGAGQSELAGFPFGQSARASMTTNAVYAGLQTTVAQRLALTGQVRQDWVAGDAPTTWRLGARVRPEGDRHPSESWHMGRHFERHRCSTGSGLIRSGYIGNPALRPERSQGWEAGFTTDIPAADGSRFRHDRGDVF